MNKNIKKIINFTFFCLITGLAGCGGQESSYFSSKNGEDYKLHETAPICGLSSYRVSSQTLNAKVQSKKKFTFTCNHQIKSAELVFKRADNVVFATESIVSSQGELRKSFSSPQLEVDFEINETQFVGEMSSEEMHLGFGSKVVVDLVLKFEKSNGTEELEFKESF